MNMMSGSVEINGTISYLNQLPWIQNGTIRDNVLFGQLYDSKRYFESLEVCGLVPDLHVLAAGDLTQIGERGITLSGGI
jgi:ABC-type multidrug transport system fused ATPase/permease subunit